MITRLFSALLIIAVFSIISGCASSMAQLSASTKLLMNEYKNATQKDSINPLLPQKIVDGYALKKVGNRYIANALITTNKNLNEDMLSEIGAKVNTVTGNILSLTIPLDAVDKLSLTKGVESIDIGIKINNN